MYDAEKARKYRLLKTYGITGDQYDQLLARQDGVCAVCSKTPEVEGQSLAVDHNHKSGEIRGLLCRYCNHRLVGRHTDSLLLRRIADYLDKGTGWYVPPKMKKRKNPPRKRKPRV